MQPVGENAGKEDKEPVHAWFASIQIIILEDRTTRETRK